MTLYAPSPEVHARYLDSGITRYSYEEVQQAIGVAEQAEAEFDSIYTEAEGLLDPYRMPCVGVVGGSESIMALAEVVAWALNHAPGAYDFRLSHGSSEALPVASLNSQAARYRSAARKLHRAVEHARKEA